MAPGFGYLLTAGAITLAAVVATVRYARTPELHSDRAARKDMAWLLWTAAVGMAIIVIRARYRLMSRSFYICTGLLAPVVLLVLYRLFRLIGLFRAERQ